MKTLEEVIYKAIWPEAEWDIAPSDCRSASAKCANAVRGFLGSEEVVNAIMRPAYERGYDEGAIDQTEGGAHPDARLEGWVQYRADARAALSSIGGE